VSVLRRLADRRNPHSLSAYFRRRRSRHLLALLATVPRPFTILDVGGEAVFWEHVAAGDGVSVVMLNNDRPEHAPESPRLSFIEGDARDLSRFGDRSFDVVVSNSVIEHVGRRADQQRMADEIRRVARRYYVQTPNRWFPVDPHYLVPFFHLLPRTIRVWTLMRFNVGWLTKTGNRATAEALDDTIELLTPRQFAALFPEASMWRERFLGLTKSMVSFHGWSASNARNRSGSSVGS
jgi:hypothetical protein